MTLSRTPDDESLALDALERTDAVCVLFEKAWQAGKSPRIEDLLEKFSGRERQYLLLELALIEFNYRMQQEPALLLVEYRDRFPDDSDTVDEAIERFSVKQTPADVPACGTPRKLRFLGDYELLEEIARGGMGIVCKARQTTLGRIVAIKMMLNGELAGEEQIARFEREAKLAARLQHPNIVAVHEVGRHAGLPYFSMDYVDGRSLKEIVRDSPLPPRDAVRYLLVAAETVQRAHEQGILHRDIKPSNVLIDHEDRVRITDFGLAKVLDTRETLTESDGIIGTPSYMSPEQAIGDRGRIGTHSDVYSLGATLYELLTARPPFAAATVVETLHQVKYNEQIALRLINPSIPRDLDTICLKCLRKDPDRRYATAAELAADLRRWSAGEPIKARPVSRAQKAWLWCRRRPAITGSIAAILLTTCIVTGLILVERRRNLRERVATTVAAVVNARGESVPFAINSLGAFPADMVQSEARRQYEAADEAEKLALAYVLAHSDEVQTQFLVSQIKDSSPDEFQNFHSALGRSVPDAVTALEVAARTATAEQDWRHKARLAMLALHLNSPALAREMCELRTDPVQRTWFIEECSTWHGDLSELAQLISNSDDVFVRSAAALAVGSSPDADVSVDDNRVWERVLRDWYQNAADTLTHSAAGWTLRQWNATLPEIDEPSQSVALRNWHVNSVGMTMMVIPDGGVSMADREVTWRQFHLFRDDLNDMDDREIHERGTDQHPQSPAEANWFEAVQFCNWLSLKEHLEPAYEPEGETKSYLGYMYHEWTRIEDSNGYRLPTEAEWEFACRAGTLTRYCFGDDDSLRNRYIVFSDDAEIADLTGSKLPNGWGLFDMHGNAAEWCDDLFLPGNEIGRQAIDPDPEEHLRVLRGGGWMVGWDPQVFLDSGSRNGQYRAIGGQFIGFRVARDGAPRPKLKSPWRAISMWLCHCPLCRFNSFAPGTPRRLLHQPGQPECHEGERTEEGGRGRRGC